MRDDESAIAGEMRNDEPAIAGEVRNDESVNTADANDRAAEAVDVDRAPAHLSSSLALLAALASVLASGVASVAALAPGAFGIVATAIGVGRGSRRALLVGCGALILGVLAAGVEGGGPEPLLVGTLGAVLAWDVGENGIGLGEQLGRSAETTRAELVHAAASLLVGSFAATVGYGAYAAAAGGQPVAALVFLLVGAIALVSALRP
ncbi:DUF7519 family protein [Halegenticoccus tardaugens]|uniref:DUF7519 family protein n=1 Tax=Halegenticoccus tardaugens TaxID=2071624 RepID=UPI001E337DCF|nr:hypothetical protein [Halegenticoccus tardaugens]